MPATETSLILGSPRFSDPRLAELAATQGALRAWREAFATGAPGAASGVTGDFAAALHEPDGRGFLVVDRFAIQTLCYRVVGGELRFAARADELAQGGAEVEKKPLNNGAKAKAKPQQKAVVKQGEPKKAQQLSSNTSGKDDTAIGGKSVMQIVDKDDIPTGTGGKMEKFAGQEL